MQKNYPRVIGRKSEDYNVAYAKKRATAHCAGIKQPQCAHTPKQRIQRIMEYLNDFLIEREVRDLRYPKEQKSLFVPVYRKTFHSNQTRPSLYPRHNH